MDYTDTTPRGLAMQLITALKQNKPDRQNEQARQYAIAITEAEKLYAWIATWLVEWPGSEVAE